MIGPNVNSQCVGRLKLPFSRNQMSWVQMSEIGELYGVLKIREKTVKATKTPFFPEPEAAK